MNWWPAKIISLSENGWSRGMLSLSKSGFLALLINLKCKHGWSSFNLCSLTPAPEWLVCLQFIFAADSKHNPRLILLPLLMFCLYFCSAAVAGVRTLPGALSWNHPRGTGAARAESQSLSVLHDDLWQHGAVCVWGSRLRTRAVRIQPVWEILYMKEILSYTLVGRVSPTMFFFFYMIFPEHFPKHTEFMFRFYLSQPLESIMGPVSGKNHLAETWNHPELCNHSEHDVLVYFGRMLSCHWTGLYLVCFRKV